MFNPKRLFAALFTGALCGVCCYFGGKIIFNLQFTGVNLGFILLNRMMIGFVIGISGLRMHWSLHGIFIGTIVGSIFAYADFLFAYPVAVVLVVLILNPVFGLIIEFVTSVIFKLPAELQNQ
ncbi:MAG: hypothetical protein GY754_24740 [bacterium]|nr:hypothetical protein [bacterium]